MGAGNGQVSSEDIFSRLEHTGRAGEGPVFYQPPLSEEVQKQLAHEPALRCRQEWRDEFLRILPKLPVMSQAVFPHYVLMVHNMLSSQQLGLSDLHYGDGLPKPAPQTGHRDREKVYMAERAMLQMVRDGNINYREAFQSVQELSSGVPLEAGPLRQGKLNVTVFTTLVCRAAMEGGLSPEAAYPLGDSYIQAAEACGDLSELSSLARAMYHDFIYRVHRLHISPNCSHAIQKCCDFIELNTDRKITAKDLAALVGYTEYYLSEKFKKETGLSVSSYTKFAKIERARVLLGNTRLPVQDIAEKLGFNTPNYFIQCFREVTGFTPAQFRRQFLEFGKH